MYECLITWTLDYCGRLLSPTKRNFKTCIIFEKKDCIYKTTMFLYEKAKNNSFLSSAL